MVPENLTNHIKVCYNIYAQGEHVSSWSTLRRCAVKRIGISFAVLISALSIGGIWNAMVTVPGYEARVAAAEKQASDLSARMDAIEQEQRAEAASRGQEVSGIYHQLDKLVDPKTGKVSYSAMDPQFLKGYWEDHSQILALRGALGGRGYGPDGKLLPVEFRSDQAFDAKVHSAQFLLKSGRTEAARALFLGALAERSIPIYACRGPVEPKEFSTWYEAPVELLPLLEGSTYSAEVVTRPAWPGSTYMEDKVLIGVGENFIKGC